MKKTKINPGIMSRQINCFKSKKIILAAAVLTVLSAAAGAYKAVGKNPAPDFFVVSVPSAQTENASVTVAAAAVAGENYDSETSPAPEAALVKTSSLYLSNGGIYVLSKKSGPCRDYRNTVTKNLIGLRCKTDNSIWHGTWVKEVDVKGYDKIRVQAQLSVNEYKDYFKECNYKGVNRDDFVDLMVLGYEPITELRNECNHVVPENEWDWCLIENTDPKVIAHCGVPMCSESKTCDIDVDVANKDSIYLVFSVQDAWMADVEGVLSNVKISYFKK